MAAEHDRDAGRRQADQLAAPAIGGGAESQRADPVHGRFGVQDRAGGGAGRIAGVVTIRSKASIGAQGRPTWTSRHRSGPPASRWIQRATGSLRRPAVMTSSGQGGASGSDWPRSRPSRVMPSRRLVTSSVGRNAKPADLERPAQRPRPRPAPDHCRRASGRGVPRCVGGAQVAPTDTLPQGW